jgi:hypothetical protein
MKKYLYINFISASFLFITLFTNCDDAGVGPVTNLLEEDYSRWKKLGIDSYSITQQQLCFCIDGGIKATIQVRGNVIVSVSDSATLKQIPQERWQWYKTIDQLFEAAINAQNSKPAQFTLQIDPTYGFPKSFWVDPNAQMADEEYGFSTTGFNSQR